MKKLTLTALMSLIVLIVFVGQEPLDTNISYEGSVSKILTTSLGYDNTAISEMERATFDLVNQERMKHGLKPLKWNEAIRIAARAHSQDMASNNYFSHPDLDGRYHDQRLEDVGVFYFNYSAENLFKVKNPRMEKNELVREAVKEWMQSPGHRENILTENLDESAVGIAVDSQGDHYFTQVFITHAVCGYKTGPCCQTPGYFDWCYRPYQCRGICR